MHRCPACASTESIRSFWGDMQYRGWRYAWRECSHCQTGYVWPRPSAEIIAQMYAPSYLQEHCGAELSGHDRIPALANEAKTVLPEMKGTVLDIGCGGGQFIRDVLAHGAAAVGVELSAETAAIVSKAVGVPVFTSISSAPNCDVVHLADVVEHHPDPAVLLKEAMEKVKPGGRLVLRHPLEGQAHFFLAVMRIWKVLRPSPGREVAPFHLQHFSWKGWAILRDRAGLIPVREQVSELHGIDSRWWIQLVKRVSELISRSPMGRARRWGNRLVGVYNR